ncbi:hypothetical protein BC828DRAFT_387470 [Blastocladiella britannica]|nr:hypothetical protein BC828DRAFT_387470 [Blastocladiella britannica]
MSSSTLGHRQYDSHHHHHHHHHHHLAAPPPGAAASTALPFAPTAAIIPTARGPIPATAPEAYDLAASYRIIVEVFTNLLAAHPESLPRLPSGCFSDQPLSGHFPFYCTGHSWTGSSNEEEEEDSSPASDPRFTSVVIDAWKFVERMPSSRGSAGRAAPPSTGHAHHSAAEPTSPRMGSATAESLLRSMTGAGHHLGRDEHDDPINDDDNDWDAERLPVPLPPPSSSSHRRHHHRQQQQRAPSPTPRARFDPTHEGTAHISCGILHLYRETAPTSPSLAPSEGRHAADTTTIHTASSHLLALLGVPVYFSAADLLTWLGPYADKVSHLRMVRDHLPHRYLVMLRFRDGKDARSFFAERNGRVFSAFEPQLAVVVKLTSIAFAARSMPPFAFPHDVLLLDPATAQSATLLSPSSESPASAATSQPPLSMSIMSPQSTPLGGMEHDGGIDLHELPTCPICMERMDAGTSGILTILCQHSFHCGCLRRWDDPDGSCPVCRYSQPRLPPRRHASPLGEFEDSLPPTAISDVDGRAFVRSRRTSSHIAKKTNDDDGDSMSDVSATSSQEIDDHLDHQQQQPYPSSTTRCHACPSSSNLWCCLICGTVGCGRYDAGHARAHYEGTQHCYALELATQRVWDYARDAFVHRLIQAADDKIVEVAPPPMGPSPLGHSIGATLGSSTGAVLSPASSAAGPAGTLALPPGYVLVSEAEVVRINKEYAWLLQSQVDAHVQVLEAQAARLQTWATRVKDDAADAARRAARAETAAETARRDLADERALSQGLAAAVADLKATVADRDAVLADMQDQLRDLMMFLETREKIESAAPEIQQQLRDGGMEVVVQPPPKGGKGKGKRKPGGRK